MERSNDVSPLHPTVAQPCAVARRGASVNAGTRRQRHGRAHQDGGAAALPGAGAVSDAHRRNRRAADRLPRPRAGGALGARPLRGMGPRKPASRALRVRPRMVARTHLGGDDDAALRSSHRLRRRMVAINRRRRERTGSCMSATRPLRRFRRWRDSFAAPSSSPTCRRRSSSTATGRSPASTIARCHGQPGAGAGEKHDAG